MRKQVVVLKSALKAAIKGELESGLSELEAAVPMLHGADAMKEIKALKIKIKRAKLQIARAKKIFHLIQHPGSLRSLHVILHVDELRSPLFS